MLRTGGAFLAEKQQARMDVMFADPVSGSTEVIKVARCSPCSYLLYQS